MYVADHLFIFTPLAEYKPVLEEVEKILAEAGLDENEMRAGAAQTGGGGGIMSSRNRR
jgi:hypothetical protein